MDRAHRLTSARDFRRVMTEGKRARASAVLCAVRRSDEVRAPRIGIRSPRSLGSAVARNRANRRLREAALPCLRQLPPGTDVVLTALPRALALDFQELEADVKRALEKAGAPC